MVRDIRQSGLATRSQRCVQSLLDEELQLVRGLRSIVKGLIHLQIINKF
jgi:hypothetical protein